MQQKTSLPPTPKTTREHSKQKGQWSAANQNDTEKLLNKAFCFWSLKDKQIQIDQSHARRENREHRHHVLLQMTILQSVISLLQDMRDVTVIETVLSTNQTQLPN